MHNCKFIDLHFTGQLGYTQVLQTLSFFL